MDIKLKLKEESWRLLLERGRIVIDFETDTVDDVNAFDNIKKHLDTQLEMCTSQGVSDVDDIVDPAQIDLFNQN